MQDWLFRNFKAFSGTAIAATHTRPGDLPDSEILAHAPEQTDLSAHIAIRTLNTCTCDRPVTFPSAPPTSLPSAARRI